MAHSWLSRSSMLNRRSSIRPAKLRRRSTRLVIERWRVQFPPRALGVKVMAKILPIITQTKRERYAAWRLRALMRKVSVIKRGSRQGSIAQTVERRSHKSVTGGSIPPRATIIER